MAEVPIQFQAMCNEAIHNTLHAHDRVISQAVYDTLPNFSADMPIGQIAKWPHFDNKAIQFIGKSHDGAMVSVWWNVRPTTETWN